jgi:hypothetical protein
LLLLQRQQNFKSSFSFTLIGGEKKRESKMNIHKQKLIENISAYIALEKQENKLIILSSNSSRIIGLKKTDFNDNNELKEHQHKRIGIQKGPVEIYIKPTEGLETTTSKALALIRAYWMRKLGPEKIDTRPTTSIKIKVDKKEKKHIEEVLDEVLSKDFNEIIIAGDISQRFYIDLTNQVRIEGTTNYGHDTKLEFDNNNTVNDFFKDIYAWKIIDKETLHSQIPELQYFRT